MDLRRTATACGAAALLALGGATGTAYGKGGPPAAPPAKPPAKAPAGPGAVTGTVVDEAGKPYAGAEVSVLASGAKEPATARSDAKGEFTVKGLAVGDALVVVRAKAMVTATSTVKVTAKEPVRADATLRLGVRFAGKLHDLRDAPVCGARIQPEVVNEGGRVFGLPPDAVTSAADGTFVADGLEPGSSYKLQISHPRFLLVELPGYPAEAGSVREDIDVTLEDAAWIVGVVVDMAGKPVPAARVSTADEREDLSGPEAQIRRFLRSLGLPVPDSFDEASGHAVDAQGKFQLGSLPPGEAEVVAHAPGYFRSTVKVTELGAGKGKEGLKVVLEPATAWVEGVVVDQDDKPVANATVRADGDEGPAGDAKTDAAGKFKVVKVRSRGPVMLRVEADGYVEDDDRDVPLNSSGRKLILTKAARIKLKVLGADGKPLASTNVRLKVGEDGDRPHMHFFPGREQADAGYDFETRPGRVEVFVSAPGYAEQSVGAWKLAPGQTLDAGSFTLDKKAKGTPPPEDGDGEDEDDEVRRR